MSARRASLAGRRRNVEVSENGSSRPEVRPSCSCKRDRRRPTAARASCRLSLRPARQRIIGAGALAACAVDGAGAWTCWNVLSPALDTMPASRIDAPADQPVLDMVFAGFQACALLAGNEVGCGVIMDWKFPTLTRIPGLPE